MENASKQIIATIDKIRPFLQRDGACVGCSAIDVTVKDTIEVILQEEVEGVIAVQVI